METGKYNDGGRLPRFNVAGAAAYGRTENLLDNRLPLKSVIGLRKPIGNTLGINPMNFNTGTNKNVTQASTMYNAGAAVGTTLGAAWTPKQKPMQGINWQNRLGEVAKNLAPYASNIANAFTSPAEATMGAMVSPQKLAMPNYDATRADIASSESAIGRNADQSVDGNSSNSIRLAARAQTLGSLNKLAEAEGNARTEVGNRQASLNMYADQVNAGTINQYRNDVTTRGNIAKSAASANLSNAADKIITQRNIQSQRDLDLEKEKLITARYDQDLVERTMKKKLKFVGQSLGKSLSSYNS